MNRSASRTPFHDSSISRHHHHTSNDATTTTGFKFQLIDKKILPQLLLKQGVEIPPTFFDAPKRDEVKSFLEDILSLVYGPHIVLRDVKSIQHDMDDSWARKSRNNPQSVAPRPLALEDSLPDRGQRQLQMIWVQQTLRYLKRFGELFGISDITLMDVARPTTDRLLLFASAIVSWIRFQEQTLAEELEQWDAVANKGEQAQKRRLERDQFREAARRIFQQAAQRAQERSMLDQAVEQKENQLYSIHDEFKTTVGKDNDSDIRHAETEEKLQHRDSKVSRLKSEIKDAKEQIVDSPRRIVETLRTTTAKAEVEQNAAKCEESLQPLNQMHRTVMIVTRRRCKKAKECIEERGEAMEANEGKLKGIEEQKKQSSLCEKQLSDQLTREKALRKNLEGTQDDLVVARDESDVVREECMNELNAKQSEISEKREEKGKIEKEIEDASNEVGQIERENEEEDREIRASTAAIDQLFEELDITRKKEEEIVGNRVDRAVAKLTVKLTDEGHPLHNVMQVMARDEVASHFLEETVRLGGAADEELRMFLQEIPSHDAQVIETVSKEQQPDRKKNHLLVGMKNSQHSPIKSSLNENHNSPPSKSSTFSSKEMRSLQHQLERLKLEDLDESENDNERKSSSYNGNAALQQQHHQHLEQHQYQHPHFPFNAKAKSPLRRDENHHARYGCSSSSYQTPELSRTMPVQKSQSMRVETSEDEKVCSSSPMNNLQNRSLDMNQLKHHQMTTASRQSKKTTTTSSSSMAVGYHHPYQHQDQSRSPVQGSGRRNGAQQRQHRADADNKLKANRSPYHFDHSSNSHSRFSRSRSRSPCGRSDRFPLNDSCSQRNTKSPQGRMLRSQNLAEKELPSHKTSLTSTVTEDLGASPLLQRAVSKQEQQPSSSKRPYSATEQASAKRPYSAAEPSSAKQSGSKSSFRVSEDASRFLIPQENRQPSRPRSRQQPNKNNNSRRDYDSRGPSII